MNDILKYKFFEKLLSLPYVEAIWLYGSRARGDNQPRADIDIAILCDGADSRQWSNIMNIVENADTLLKIDCVRFDQIMNDKLKENILRDKKVIYAKTTNYTHQE